MKWIVLWSMLNGTPITGLPEKQFDTERQCIEFANSRVGMVSLWFNIPPLDIKFECQSIPFIKPK